HEAVEQLLRENHPLLCDDAERSRARIRSWHRAVRAEIGPTAAARTVFDRVAVPLFRQLGYLVVPVGGGSNLVLASLEAGGTPALGLVVSGGGRDDPALWRQAIRHGIGLDVPWCVALTGPVLRIMDSRRTYSRRFVQF